MLSLPNVDWRTAYVVSILGRFAFSISDSYIHPDEHFQSLQVLTNKIFGYTTSLPWEFTSDQPARSFGPLYLVYGPILYLLKWSHLDFSPRHVWYLCRLQITILGWMITDKCIYKLMPTKPERVKALLFIQTSYITMTYQSHLFSNSIETILLLICVTLIDDLRSCTESKVKATKKTLFFLGAVVSIGLFNRVTFPAFLVIPAWFVASYLWVNKLQSLSLIVGFLIPTVAFVLVDTVQFSTGEINFLKLSNYVFTPLNNLIYNSSFENLSEHGIHPLYTHLLVNLPQIVGPSGVFLLAFYKLKDSYWKTIPFLTCVSGLAILSLIPHQELRFLVPLLPLLCCCFDLRKYNKHGNDPEEKHEAPEITKSSLVTLLMLVWYVFNALMAILMGTLHQGGVVPALDDLYFLHKQKPEIPFVHVWWRTYSPPNWLLGELNTTVVTLTDEAFEYDFADFEGNYIFDTMGSDVEKVENLLSELKEKTTKSVLQFYAKEKSTKKVFFIAPIASYNVHFKHTEKFRCVLNYTTHLDMDHLNFSSWEALTPGLGIYELL